MHLIAIGFLHAVSPIIRIFIWIMFLASLGYYSAVLFSAASFVLRRNRASLNLSFAPSVSILKPVYGVDFASSQNFSSFCEQNYPSYEILFATNDASDPAVPLIQSLIAKFPQRNIRLITSAPFLGENRKVNNLVTLLSQAAHELVVLTDGDVRVGPDFLRNIVAPFQNPSVGAVSSLYRGVAEPNLFTHLEALGAATDFAAGVLVAAQNQRLTFALGAAIATTKSAIQRIGGLEPIAHHLADDYELGNRIAKSGAHVLLSTEVVSTMYPAQSARGFWQHQLRWARTVRLCRPVSYLGLIFTHGLIWAVLAALIAPSTTLAIAAVAAYLVFRFAVTFSVGHAILDDSTVRSRWFLIPLRDAIHFIVWLASFASNRITWGNSQFQMKNGRMVSIRPPSS